MSITPPDPTVLRAQLDSPRAGRTFTQAEFRHYNSPETRQVEYGLDDASYIGARTIMAPGGSSNASPGPFSAIPEAKTAREHYEAIQVFAEIQPSDPRGSWGSQTSYFADDGALPSDAPTRGYHYSNESAQPVEGGSPTSLTQVPTSTTNPSRPRTVAAGYDPQRKCLTMVFRDGTYYNYYEVTQGLWNNFTRAYSPGRFILAHLDSKPRGVADVQSLPAYAREALYKITRTGQIQRGGLTGTQTATARRRRVQQYGKNLGGTGRARLAKMNAPPLTG